MATNQTELTPEEQAAVEAAKAEKERVAAEKKAAKEAEKQRKADERAAKKAEKEKQAAEKKQARQSVTQNGVSRPMSGATLRVWELADEISKTKGAPAERKEVSERGVAEGLQIGTIHTQYGRWRKFHGLVTVREVSAPAAPPAPVTAQVDTPAGEMEVPAVPSAPEVTDAPAGE